MLMFNNQCADKKLKNFHEIYKKINNHNGGTEHYNVIVI